MLRSAVGAKLWFSQVKADFGVMMESGGLDAKVALMKSLVMKTKGTSSPIFFGQLSLVMVLP